MADSQNKIVIVPCSGIGKTYGSVSREAAYTVVEDLRPGFDPTGGAFKACPRG